MESGLAARRWGGLTPTLAIPLIVLAIMAFCVSGFDDFFFIDDAQNENLPFYREMGRMWLSGQMPILTTSSWFGSNILVDMVLSPFAPQTVVTSIVAALTPANTAAVFAFTFTTMSVIVLSGWWLGRLYGLRDAWSLLLGFLLATQPVYLHVLASSWWNSAGAYAWCLFSAAALLQLRREFRPGYFVLALGGACALFATAGTQFQLAYGLLAMVILALDLHEWGDWRSTARLALAPAGAVLIAAVPLMSEFVAVADWLPRASGWHNRQNLLVPHWGMIVNAFNPYYGSWMSWWGGPWYLPVSFGYASVLLVFALAFFRWRVPRGTDQTFLAAFAAVALLLAMAPAQVGPIRVPYRVLPLLAAPICIYTLQRIAGGTVVVNRRRALLGWGFALMAAALTTFSAKGSLADLGPMLRLQLTLGLLGGGLLALVLLARRLGGPIDWFKWAAALSVAAWSTAHMLTPTLAWSHFPYSELADGDGVRRSAKPGYVLSLCARMEEAQPRALHELVSGRFLLYGQPAINGYSPVGHKGFDLLFPHDSPHGFFSPVKTLTIMTRPAPELPGLHLHQLFRISEIYTCRSDFEKDATLDRTLAEGGLVRVRNLDAARVLVEPRAALPAIGSLLGTDGASGIEQAHPARMRTERFRVRAASHARTLYFSRLYWPGYSATLDGRPLAVSPYLRALVRVEVPPGAAGELVLHYEPVTWRWTRWALLLGLAIGAWGAWAPRGRRKH